MLDFVLLLQFLGDEDVPEEETSEGEGRDELWWPVPNAV